MRYGNARPDLRQSNLRHFLTLTRPKPEKTSKQQGESSPLSMQVSPAYAPALSAASRQPGPLRRSAPTTAPSGERRAEPSRRRRCCSAAGRRGRERGRPSPRQVRELAATRRLLPAAAGAPGPLPALGCSPLWSGLVKADLEMRAALCSFGCLRPPERWDPRPRGALLLSELQHTRLRGKRKRHRLATSVFEAERAEEGETLKTAPSVIWSLFQTHFSPHELLAMSSPPAPSSYFVVSSSGISYKIPLCGYKSLTLQHHHHLEKQDFPPHQIKIFVPKMPTSFTPERLRT